MSTQTEHQFQTQKALALQDRDEIVLRNVLNKRHLDGSQVTYEAFLARPSDNGFPSLNRCANLSEDAAEEQESRKFRKIFGFAALRVDVFIRAGAMVYVEQEIGNPHHCVYDMNTDPETAKNRAERLASGVMRFRRFESRMQNSN